MSRCCSMEAHPSRISALRARVMMAATPQELSVLCQELEQLRFSYTASTTVQPSCTLWGWSSEVQPGPRCVEVSRAPGWGSDATSSTVVSTPRAVVPVFTEVTKAVEADGCATPVRWPGDDVCSDVSRSPPSAFQSPTTVMIRKTFIEFLDPEDDATQGQTGPLSRLVQSCPLTPKGSCDACDSINTLTAVAERLAQVSLVTVQGEPAKRGVDTMGSYIPDSNNTGPAELRILRLADWLEELPSQGSALHSTGGCKPCAFVHTKGCNTGKACNFCHLCDQGSSKRRKKFLREHVRTSCMVSGTDGHSKVMHGNTPHVRVVPQ